MSLTKDLLEDLVGIVSDELVLSEIIDRMKIEDIEKLERLYKYILKKHYSLFFEKIIRTLDLRGPIKHMDLQIENRVVCFEKVGGKIYYRAGILKNIDNSGNISVLLFDGIHYINIIHDKYVKFTSNTFNISMLNSGRWHCAEEFYILPNSY